MEEETTTREMGHSVTFPNTNVQDSSMVEEDEDTGTQIQQDVLGFLG
jgi:hypothetical protein